MKMLVVGIDGGTSEIFDAFDMPFWKSLRSNNVNFDVTEDLNQRGWARMISGQGAEETGALYMRPAYDNNFGFDFTYNYKMMSKTSGFQPVWSFAEAAGVPVGIMNIPTTSPAQPVNGFYISGGGGGIFQGGLPEGAAYPQESEKVLLEEEYIFDTRLGAQSFRGIDQLCAHINHMLEARTRAFIRLAQKHETGFGFIAYRATTVLLFLAMSEIAHIMRHPIDHLERQSWSTPWLPLVAEHMRVLDDALARLFDALQPEHHIIVSDHSIVPWTHNIDFNGFLSDADISSFHTTPGRFTKNLARTVLQPGFRRQLMASPSKDAFRTLLSAGTSLNRDSRAFSGRYVYGIYINDKERFGGPVSDAELSGEIEQIIEAFNWAARIRQIPMEAVPYRSRFESSSRQEILPDITILQSGHAFPSTLGSAWYVPNPNFGPVNTVAGVGGMHTGQKGRHPILMADPGLAALRTEQDPVDLRLVHKLTEALFSQNA